MDLKIKELYGIEVEHLCARNPDGSKKTYEQMFYHVPVRKNSQSVQVERRFRDDDSRGFPVHGRPWCQSTLKRVPDYRPQGSITGFPPNTRYNWCQKLKITQDSGIPRANIPMVQKTEDRQGKNPFSTERGIATRKNRNVVEYIGIAADEPKRFGQLNERKRAPLVEFGIDEELCGLYCRYNNMLSPSYETSFRDGCWFCHNQGVNQLRILRKNYPDLWKLLLKWDKDSPVTFKADGTTVADYDRRFSMEESNLVPMDRSFRWSMLDNPPLFTATAGEQLKLF